MAIQDLNKLAAGSLLQALQIKFTEYNHPVLIAEMPVNENTKQPYGFLHGGAVMALAESVGGALSFLSIDTKINNAVVIEANANHIHSVRYGKVTARAEFLHKGKSTHVIDVRVTDESDRLISVCRLTNKILKKSNN